MLIGRRDWMEQIKAVRKALGMTQEQLAKLLGVTQGTIAQWEKGLTHPTFEKLPKIAEVLGVSVDALIGREG
jgi:transcriptional regulator with XRE-family HTH domain